MLWQIQVMLLLLTLSFLILSVWVFARWNPAFVYGIYRLFHLSIKAFPGNLHRPSHLLLIMFPLLLAFPLDSSIGHPSHQERIFNTLNKHVLHAEGFRRLSQLYESNLIDILPTVRAEGLRPELAYVLPTVISAWQEVLGENRIPRISSANDKVHAPNSRHYRDLALDFTIIRDNITFAQGLNIRKILEKRLGPRYTILFGNDPGHMSHLHIQYDGPSWDLDMVLSLLFVEAAWRYQQDPALLMGIARASSGLQWNYLQDDHMGIMALHKNLLLEHGVKNALDLHTQVDLGARLLQSRINNFAGDVDRALASWKFPNLKELQGVNNWWKHRDAKRFVEAAQIFAQEYRDAGLPNRTGAIMFSRELGNETGG